VSAKKERPAASSVGPSRWASISAREERNQPPSELKIRHKQAKQSDQRRIERGKDALQSLSKSALGKKLSHSRIIDPVHFNRGRIPQGEKAKGTAYAKSGK